MFFLSNKKKILKLFSKPHLVCSLVEHVSRGSHIPSASATTRIINQKELMQNFNIKLDKQMR